MSTSRMVQHYRSQCNDSSSSCSSSSSTSSATSSRRTIFPVTVHEKYTSLSLPPTPIVYSKKQSRQRCLSDHVTLPSKSLILSSTSSIESDMPSLMSSSTISDCTVSTTCTSQSITSKNNDDNNNTCCIIVGTTAQDVVRRRNVVRFDPRIIVHEYVRSKEDRMSLWLTVQELNSFKMNALRCIMMYNAASRGCDSNSNGITWSSPISSSMSMNGRSSRVLFSHPALGVDNEYDSDNTTSDQNYTPSLHRPIVPAAYQIKQFRDAVTENEIRNILIVDPLDTFLKLYTKGLRRIFPHCTIITANCTDDAIQQIQKLKSNKKSSGCFDIIIHDDLNEQAGSKLSIENTDGRTTKAIYINVCSNTRSTGIIDRTNSSSIINEQHGTTSIIDFIWTKPPPLMNDTLRDILLKALLIKRSRIGIAKKLFF